MFIKKFMVLLRKSTLKSLFIIGCITLLMSGCSEAAQQAEGTPTPTVTASSTATATPTPTPAPFTFPLTGLPSDKLLKSRPYMVMIENSPAARPQSGLDQADIVYEILAEGEVTRFVAVYQSQDAKTIGPVRSIRPYFVEIGDALDAVIVHAGWSQEAMNMMSKRKISHLDQVYGDDKFYWRDSSRKAPHNVYTSVEKMAEGAIARKFRQEWNGPILSFVKDGKRAISGQEVLKFKVPYIQGYEVAYEYDAASGQYARSMAGKPHNDKETDKQLTATNVLVLEAKHRIIDKEGRREVDVFGPGNGRIFQQGVMQEITWERKNGFLRAYAGGKEVPLLPGKTWVQIVPIGHAVKVE